MSSGYLLNPLLLVVDTLLNLYIMLVLLRFMFQAFRADFYNPVSQFVVKVTSPPLKPLRRVIPSIAGHDTSSLVLSILLVTFKFLLLKALGVSVVDIGGATVLVESVSYLGLLIMSVAELVALALNIFLFAIIILVILSWVSPGAPNPIISLIYSLANPIMRPIQRFMPNIGGLDLSPLFATLGIMVLKLLLIPPIIALANMAP